jgi:hypothetical protein
MSEPVGVEDLKDAILRMIVREFGKRAFDWQTAEQALSLAAYEIKLMALHQLGGT